MENSVTITKGDNNCECQVYSKRWIILLIFVMYSASNSAQWVQYSIIENIVEKFYGVSANAISWTSMIYMITYIPLIFPANYLLEKKGLKWTVVIGAFGTCLGSWIKVFSVNPDGFLISFIGQTIVAMSQSCILSIPSHLSAVWFGPNQLSLSCSIGVFGNQLGIAVGFCLTPFIVANHDNLLDIKNDLTILFYSFAIFTTLIFLLTICFFSAKPPRPPSKAQAKAIESKQNENTSIYESYLRIFRNKSYVLLTLSYGINIGAFYAISTLLNPLIIRYHSGHEVEIGIIGLLIIIAGMFGSLVCGFILDKTHLYKETTVMIYAMSLMGTIIFSASIKSSLLITAVSASILGFFMTGLLPVGFEFATELTYPEPEGTTTGILNAVVQIFGIILTNCYGVILEKINDHWANTFLSVCLVIGIMLTSCIKSNLLRQAAGK